MAQNQNPPARPPGPDPALKRLERFVGTWEINMEAQLVSPVPAWQDVGLAAGRLAAGPARSAVMRWCRTFTAATTNWQSTSQRAGAWPLRSTS
jgi:hypothetical protein